MMGLPRHRRRVTDTVAPSTPLADVHIGSRSHFPLDVRDPGDTVAYCFTRVGGVPRLNNRNSPIGSSTSARLQSDVHGERVTGSPKRSRRTRRLETLRGNHQVPGTNL